MKDLKNYIRESILDDIDDQLDNTDKLVIKHFIEKHYNCNAPLEISDKPNKDGKYEVSTSGNVLVKHYTLKTLAHELFQWHKIGGDFYCNGCDITSLEGAPIEVNGGFYCQWNNITSLKGAPKVVNGQFNCSNTSISTLEGAPEKVGCSFRCIDCESLVSFKGAPKEVGLSFDCAGSLHVKSLNGLPKKIHGDIYISLPYGQDPEEFEKKIRKMSKIDGVVDWALV